MCDQQVPVARTIDLLEALQHLSFSIGPAILPQASSDIPRDLTSSRSKNDRLLGFTQRAESTASTILVRSNVAH